MYWHIYIKEVSLFKSISDTCIYFQILDGISRLAHLFIKICSAGSVLFKNFRATFYCKPGRKVNATVDFGLSDLKLQGHTDAQTDVNEQIRNVCQFFQECLQQWLNHINDQRKEFYYLNYFTTEQLVLLRNGLAPLFTGQGTVSLLLYPMLEAVHPGCRQTHLQLAMRETVKQIQELQRAQASGNVGEENLDQEPNSVDPENKKIDMEPRKRFIYSLRESGFSKKLILEAVKKFKPNETEEGQSHTYC